MPTLFDPIQVGDLHLPNRIFMAPLTRCRASSGRVPNALMVEYYRQRAGAGLILTEATVVSSSAVGYPDTPGIWNEEQVAGWRDVTNAVHGDGGHIVCQLWHVGRVSDPEYLNGALPVAPSAIAVQGEVSLLRPKRAYVTPRALEVAEIHDIVEDFRKAALNAKEAGFDGVELHAANGYLIDQFLQSRSNQRTDEYGGSIENRARFLLEVLDAVLTVWPAGRVGVHLAPRGDAFSMGDDDPASLFGYCMEQLSQRKIAFVFTREYFEGEPLTPQLSKQFSGVFIANEKFDGQLAQQVVADGVVDAVAFGKDFIANPDLPRRLQAGASLNPYQPETFYGGGEEGYTDYPFME